MTKKIFRSVFAASLAVMLACLGAFMGVLYRYFSGVQQTQLRAQTILAAQGVAGQGMAYFKDLESDGCRITWVAADGRVLYDTGADAAAMENHAQRQEIRQALESGWGESTRFSDTLGVRTLYRAKRLPDGSVVRVSAAQYTVWALVLGMYHPILFVVLLAVGLSAFLANRLAKHVVAPLNSLDMDHPLDNDAYEEIAPLLTRIESQHRRIDQQMRQLQQRRDEFSAVVGSMNEGLVLLNPQGVVLSINTAASRMLAAGPDCVGRSFLTVERSSLVWELVKQADAGSRAEGVLELGGSRYQVDVSPVLSEGELVGKAILIFDVTEKAMAEEQRREFTANVSHELKTPLQTIMGSAELIENGLAKPADVPDFAGRIRSESARLVTLIDDIIRLSQLDEGTDLPREEVELLALCREAAEAVRPAAQARDISLEVGGQAACVRGVRRLLYEIAYNLCDNAVKYNRDGGSVLVTVERRTAAVCLTVRDTGIGIPPEHQARVFERFYRVDKSHSRQTGGTGLGLSIVKHAVQYHGGHIQLESAPGRGTCVTVVFPAEQSPEA